MATSTVDALDAVSADSWPHHGILREIDHSAVVFNQAASLPELVAWAYGQLKIAMAITACSMDDESKQGQALGAVDALLEPAMTALNLAVDRMQVSHG